MKRDVTRRHVVTGIGPIVIGVSVAGCSGSGDGGGGGDNFGPRRAQMTDDIAYDPVELPARPGQTVIWENTGSVEHTVTAYEERIPEGARTSPQAASSRNRPRGRPIRTRGASPPVKPSNTSSKPREPTSTSVSLTREAV